MAPTFQQLFTSRKLLVTLLCVLFLLPSLVFGECTCDTKNEERDKDQARRYKLAAIASILVAGAIGVSIPILGKFLPALRPETDIFFIIKAFAAGVILATGFIHVLPDAFEKLTSPCLCENPWGKFPLTGFVAMVSAIGTLIPLQPRITLIAATSNMGLETRRRSTDTMRDMRITWTFILMQLMVIPMVRLLWFRKPSRRSFFGTE